MERRDKRRDGHNHFRAVVYDPARQIRVALRMPLARIPLYHQIAAHALEIAEPAQLPKELSNPADPRAALSTSWSAGIELCTNAIRRSLPGA